jgi:hypothetical protein
MKRWLLILALLLTATLLPATALGGPVDWHELEATAEGRQWWDAGSLRRNREGNLTVLSRFQPAASEQPGPSDQADQPDQAYQPERPSNSAGAGPRQRPPASELYVMEIDCGQSLFRDTSINGIPQWGSRWQPAGPDGLIEETIQAVCAAGADLLAAS